MIAGVAVASLLVGAGCGSDEQGDTMAIDGALTLPSFDERGDRLAYLSIHDGLVSSTVVDVSSGEELWTGPSSYFRGELGPLDRPLIVGSAMYVTTFHAASLEASISRIDLATGAVAWTTDVGPHYGGPFECGTDVVCVHAHPSVAPLTLYRFDRSDGEVSEGSVGGTTVYADTEVLIGEAGARIVASRDSAASEAWSVKIADAFGERVSTAGGSWSERLGDSIVVWLGQEGALGGRAVSFDLGSGSFKTLADGRPCLVPIDLALETLCFVADDEIVLVDTAGRVRASTTNELEDDDLVPSYVFDADGEVVITDGVPLRITSSGFVDAELPSTGWCPYEPEAVSEPGQGPDVTVALPRRFFPCDVTSSRPLGGPDARKLAIAAASANATQLVAYAGGSIAYFEAPNRLVLTSR